MLYIGSLNFKGVIFIFIKHFNPPKELDIIIDYIWVIEAHNLTSNNREDIIIPLGHINIVFNYGAEYLFLETDQEKVLPNQVIVGQIMKAKKVRYGQDLNQLGISLKPAGFKRLYDINVASITEKVVDVKEIDPSLINLYKNLQCEKNIEQKINKVNHYFNLQKNEETEEILLTEDMINYIEKHYHIFNILKMADFFSRSISATERFFKKNVGLTPKAYSDIIKFSQNITSKSRRKAMQQYYYDQSHFIKKSKKYSGKTVNELEGVEDELTLQYIINWDEF